MNAWILSKVLPLWLFGIWVSFCPVRALGIIQFTAPWYFFCWILTPIKFLKLSFCVFFPLIHYFWYNSCLSLPKLDSLSPKFKDTTLLCWDSPCHHCGLQCGCRQKGNMTIMLISFDFLISKFSVLSCILSNVWKKLFHVFCPVPSSNWIFGT